MNHSKKTHDDSSAQDVSEIEMITLTAKDWGAFVKALDNPDKPRTRLAAAVEQHREWQRRDLKESRQKWRPS